jgi:hypothetical protein
MYGAYLTGQRIICRRTTEKEINHFHSNRFYNAFGSVPRRLFLQNLTDLGLPDDFGELIADLYTGASSVISLPTGDTEPSSWMSGVKQGCPLSPLLFNLCLRRYNDMRHLGYKAGSQYLREPISLNVLAYADDSILISETEEGMTELLATLETFCENSLMEVNPSKCVPVSSVWFLEGGGVRGSTRAAFVYKGVELPKLGIQQSSKYLGIPIGGHKHYRCLPTRETLTVMREQLEKIFRSPLLLPQKIDALQRFVLPKVDYLLQSGDISKSQLDEFDAHVRGTVQKWIGGKGIPRPIFHMSWKDGGLSLPTVEGRLNTMVIRTVVQLLQTQDKHRNQILRAFIDEERDNRHFTTTEEGTTKTGFFNWHLTATSGLTPETETTTIFWKAFEAARRLNIELIPKGRNWEQTKITHAEVPHEKMLRQKMFRITSRSKYPGGNGGRSYIRKMTIRSHNIVRANTLFCSQRTKSRIGNLIAAEYARMIAA